MFKTIHLCSDLCPITCLSLTCVLKIHKHLCHMKHNDDEIKILKWGPFSSLYSQFSTKSFLCWRLSMGFLLLLSALIIYLNQGLLN